MLSVVDLDLNERGTFRISVVLLLLTFVTSLKFFLFLSFATRFLRLILEAYVFFYDEIRDGATRIRMGLESRGAARSSQRGEPPQEGY
jgi:hypothetical protein